MLVAHASPSLCDVMVAFREATAAMTAMLLAPLQRAKEELWTEAVPEQQRLSIQLARNSIYFTLSCLAISLFGDQLAV